MMASLLDETGMERLSDAELAILLLAAYCHDVGMTPARELSRAISRYVLTAEHGLVNDEVASDLQIWLDKNRPDLTLPISGDALTSAKLSVAEDICAYYGRSKHNDWSEDWIRAEFINPKAPSLYNGWVDDLVTVCKSHHEGLVELRTDRFNAKIVGSPPQNMNLRYLAAILRLADVTEFDPERTPDIILSARDIAPGSRIYWHKDKEISFQLDAQKRQILFTARTPSAQIHSAVLMTAKWVDDELMTCSALAQENAFTRGTILPSTRDNYEWVWPAKLTTDIREADGTFVFIDGAFRPSPNRILALLSGTALYGRPIVAIRELVQNAVDAVREEIAYQRLASPSPQDHAVAMALSAIHSVKLRFYEEEGRYWLQCVDSGTGMSKAIIERSLLVGGSAPRPESKALERSAKAAGFSVGRTGQFGIGVLSYFMIADRLEVATRRSQLSGDPDATGWRFVIEGLSDFGELTKEQRVPAGSDIRLRLKSDILGAEPRDWLSTLWDYLKSTLRWMPCAVYIQDEVFDFGSATFGPGWSDTLERFKPSLIKGIELPEQKSDELYTEEWKEQFSIDLSRAKSIQDNALRAVRWTTPQEFELPNKIGNARISLPYFDIDGASSLAYISLNGSDIIPIDGRRDIVIPKYEEAYAWKGFGVGKYSRSTPIICADINYTDGMEISVNRQSIGTSDEDDVVKSFIREKAIPILKDMVKSTEGTPFSSLNQALSIRHIDSNIPLDDNIFWKVSVPDNTRHQWRELQFPVCSPIRTSFMARIEEHPLASTEEDFQFAEALSEREHSDGLTLASWIGGGRIVTEAGPNSFGATVALSWNSRSEMKRIDGKITSMTAEFPPEWDELIAVSTTSRVILNKVHKLLPLLSAGASYIAAPKDKIKLETVIAECVDDPAKTAQFLIGAVRRDEDFWRVLAQRFTTFFLHLMSVLEGVGLNRLVIWHAHGYGDTNRTIEISNKGVRSATGNRQIYDNPILSTITSPSWMLTDMRKRK
jgi:hypothetical protein